MDVMNLPMAVWIAVGALGVAAVALLGFLARRRRRGQRRPHHRPILLFDPGDATTNGPAATSTERVTWRAAPPDPPPTPRRESRVDAHFEGGGEPPEGTLQLLPGRMEIVSGPGSGGEVRFVRPPGDDPTITLGRSSGPPHRHVELKCQTVSRLHARLRFEDGRWSLTNLSSTNPTVVNGRVLAPGTDPVHLGNGDRVEMGEMTFVFRQPEIHDRLALRSSCYTDKGRRPRNEDAVVVRTLRDGRELAAVCDGMGGHRGGAYASHRAVESLIETLEGGADLEEAVQRANHAVVTRASEAHGHEGMGTTLVALLRSGRGYEIANVGDSRAYRITPGGTFQVTEDHSFVAEAVREGRMTREQAKRTPWGNTVTRTIGTQPKVEVDLYTGFSASEPHWVVLVSDGVHTALSGEELGRLVRSMPNVVDAAREIGEEALRRGSDDNVAAAVVAFGDWRPGGGSGSA